MWHCIKSLICVSSEFQKQRRERVGEKQNLMRQKVFSKTDERYQITCLRNDSWINTKNIMSGYHKHLGIKDKKENAQNEYIIMTRKRSLIVDFFFQ